MAQFKKIVMANSNEVSLCSKYNSGANKQTEFELVKDKEGKQPVDIKPVLQEMVKYANEVCEQEKKDVVQGFKDFLDYWLEYDINNTLYGLLEEGLRNGLYNLAHNEDLTKEEKTDEFIKLFNEFLTQYRNLPITKTADNKYEVSLVSKSLIQDNGTNPQNETDNITKENTSEMKNDEQKTAIQKAVELLTSAFSLKKTETPADENPEVKQEVEPKAEPTDEKPAEQAEETVEVKPEEVEAPVVKQAEKTVEVKPDEVEKVEKTKPEGIEPEVKPEEIEKTSEPSGLETVLKQKLDLEKELAEIKKAQAEKEETITKMSYIQKAKDEYSMLVGTPEEIGEKLYDISKSNLAEDSKSFILDQLKKVAKENQELTIEKGSITQDSELEPEDEVYVKAREIAKSKNISINKALREVK